MPMESGASGFLTMPDKVGDKYTDFIELSNACRTFYQNRLKTAERLKEKWGGEKRTFDTNANQRKRSSLDIAMDQLRTEMSSLMDQDLSLMKQLLTLNEEIEDLKWRRRYCWNNSSFYASSCQTESRDWTSSDLSVSKSENILTKYPSPSSLSLPINRSNISFYDDTTPTGTFNRREQNDVTCSATKEHSRKRDSYDSGIHENFTEVPVPTLLVTHL